MRYSVSRCSRIEIFTAQARTVYIWYLNIFQHGGHFYIYSFIRSIQEIFLIYRKSSIFQIHACITTLTCSRFILFFSNHILTVWLDRIKENHRFDIKSLFILNAIIETYLVVIRWKIINFFPLIHVEIFYLSCWLWKIVFEFYNHFETVYSSNYILSTNLSLKKIQNSISNGKKNIILFSTSKLNVHPRS